MSLFLSLFLSFFISFFLSFFLVCLVAFCLLAYFLPCFLPSFSVSRQLTPQRPVFDPVSISMGFVVDKVAGTGFPLPYRSTNTPYSYIVCHGHSVILAIDSFLK